MELNRRVVLKLSIAAGITFAAGGIFKAAHAVTVDQTPFNKPEFAKKRFLKSMNCSQAVLETYAQTLGLSVKQARSVASAFAGGMGIGSECGAVTGALMVIGMKYGKTSDSDSRADSETFKRVTELIKEFKAKHKHIGCSELLGTDMGTPEGVKKAADLGYFTSRCPEYVKSAIEILEKIMV